MSWSKTWSYLINLLANRIRRLLFTYLVRRSVPFRGGNVRHLTRGTVVKTGLPWILQLEAEATCYVSENTNLPVPKVYDFFTSSDAQEGYLIMQYIPGEMLQRKWKSLTTDQRLCIMRQVKAFVSELRRLRQPEPAGWIGSCSRGPFNDTSLADSNPYGPFNNQADFNDWHISKFERFGEISSKVKQRLAAIRHELPDDSEIVFTHGDITRRNILVDIRGPGPDDVSITALIDWEQAGWRPAYWERFKFQYTTSTTDDWCYMGVREMLDGYEQEISLEQELVLIRGSVF